MDIPVEAGAYAKAVETQRNSLANEAAMYAAAFETMKSENDALRKEVQMLRVDLAVAKAPDK